MHNWRVFARIVNSIITEMIQSWNDKAYLLYNVFAGTQPIAHSVGYTIADINVAKGMLLSHVARQSEQRQKAFVSGVVTVLQKLQRPSRTEGVSVFNPIIILRRWLRNIRYEFPTIQ